MSSTVLRSQLERALALVHAALAEPNPRRRDEAMVAAGELIDAVETARRDSWTLSDGHALLEGLDRLRLLVRLLDGDGATERVA